MAENRRADYGLDAPRVVQTMATLGFAFLLVAFVLPVGRGFQPASMSMAVSFLLTALAMFASSRIGKKKARDALLDAIALEPGDTVLDVGCGRGLMLIGAAKRVTSGRAVGLDLWSSVDQLNNSREATLENAEIEGVAERVDVRDGDMRTLPFEASSFDAVVSSLAIHNVDSKADRDTAIREIARVLKPGGRVGILDILNVSRYASVLESSGVKITSGPRFTPWIFPPARVITGIKS